MTAQELLERLQLLDETERIRQPQEVQDLVVALCEVRAWRAEETAALLSRNAETVRQNYLPPCCAPAVSP